MGFCRIHGRNDSALGCYECGRIKERSDSTNQECSDHKCPHCLNRTLISGCSRCPKCTGEVTREDWNRIRAKEEAELKEVLRVEDSVRAEAEAAEAELLRTAPQREAKAAIEALLLRRKQSASTGASLGAIIGGIVLGCGGCMSCLNHDPGVAFSNGIPLYNGLTALILGAIGGAIIGTIIGYSFNPSKG